MKTKTLIMVCLLLGFGLTQLYAQQKPYVDKWEVYLGFYIPCTGEVIEGTVTLHVIFLFSPDGFPLFIHQNPSMGELTCLSTGNVYKFVGGFVLNQSSYMNPGGAGLIYVENTHLMGPDISFDIHIRWTTVIKPNGEWVHDYYIENIQCN